MCLGYGQTGPQSQSPGYDSIASAVSGMMHITGPEVRVFLMAHQDNVIQQRLNGYISIMHVVFWSTGW